MMYVGPDSVMPLASGLAAGVGLVLLMWRRALALLRTALPFLRKSGKTERR